MTLTGALPSPAVVLLKLATTWSVDRPEYVTFLMVRCDHAVANPSAVVRASLVEPDLVAVMEVRESPAAAATATTPATTEAMMMRLLMATIQQQAPLGYASAPSPPLRGNCVAESQA